MLVPSLSGTLFSSPPCKKPDYFLKSLSILPQATLNLYTGGHFAIITGKFWSLYIFKMLAAARRENTQLMHLSCLGRTPQRSPSLLDPPEKLCLWSVLLHLEHFGCLFLSFLYIPSGKEASIVSQVISQNKSQQNQYFLVRK